MATLDFKELAGDPAGENFQALVRLIGERRDLRVQWTGRGPDGGRDLIFVEEQIGPLNSTPVRWLVSCKDNSQNNRSVIESDVGSVLDKVRQHDCQAFMLATTTTASSGLKELLDKLDAKSGGPIQTKVWDRFELTKLLLKSEFADLLLQFFPKTSARESVQKLDAARAVVEASVPRFVCGVIRERLVSYDERKAELKGRAVWAHDASQAAIIDDLMQNAAYRFRLVHAVKKADELHFDAFIAFIDRLIRNFPDIAKRLLYALAKHTSDSGKVFNIVEILRETEDFDLSREMELTRKCDSETLFEMYEEIARDILDDASIWDWRLPTEVETYADNVELEYVGTKDFEFCGGDGVSFSCRVEFSVTGHSSDPEEYSPGRAKFSYSVRGYFVGDGVEIETIGHT